MKVKKHICQIYVFQNDQFEKEKDEKNGLAWQWNVGHAVPKSSGVISKHLIVLILRFVLLLHLFYTAGPDMALQTEFLKR